jgi:thiamine pyrophosphate-dependent acetolactate synthase large subunit-like protein
MDVCVSIIVVTRNAEFFQAGASVVSDLREGLFERVTIDSDWGLLEASRQISGPRYLAARAQAWRFLEGSGDRIALHVVQAQSLSAALDKLSARDRDAGVHQVGMAYIDYSDPDHASRSIAEIDRDLQAFYAALRARRVQAFETPSSTAVFQSADDLPYDIQPMNFIRCVIPADPDVLHAQLLSLWMDFYELSFANRRIRPGDRAAPSSAMAEMLTRFLCERAGANWVLQYYTGSLVSSLISAFEAIAADLGVPVLRGPNEHALACAAMANWQLYEKPSVTIVTSGMIDEFRGTLANLCETRARGFIVCAEQNPSLWCAFQSTITPDSDSREVLHARGAPHVFIDNPDDLALGMERALRLYDSHRGPVFILATQAVMNVKSCAQPNLAPPPRPKAAISARDADMVARAVALLNSGPDRILLQPGRLAAKTCALLQSVAERAGLALADSIIHPGVAPSHLGGAPNPAYLGTLGVYGFSDAVYRFLHQDGRIAPRETQALFFLGDKIAQVATPFTEAKLTRQFHIAQVVEEAEHLAPFADIAVKMNPHDFLLEVERRLDCPPELLARRRAAIQAARRGDKDLASLLPSLPMTANYFFGALGALLSRMIAQDGFDFTGLYDVGRCGISAIRNLPRTRPGFSGWYGRALMGDAYMAMLAVAQTCPTDVLTFVGDGAHALVPDILPSLLENALANGARRDRSFSIFVLCNNGLSAISSYQERILFNRTSRQMRVLNLARPEFERDLCGYRVSIRNIDAFDPEDMRKALMTRGRINLFRVKLAHNNEGDGMSLVHVSGWQQNQPARAVARARERT